MIEDLKYKKLRYRFIRLFERKCMCCGSSDRIHVDHIKPKSLHPELKYDPTNLQILCGDCNEGKLNIYSDDFRTIEDMRKIYKEFFNREYKWEKSASKRSKKTKKRIKKKVLLRKKYHKKSSLEKTRRFMINNKKVW